MRVEKTVYSLMAKSWTNSTANNPWLEHIQGHTTAWIADGVLGDTTA
jgi:hypothetical protein